MKWLTRLFAKKAPRTHVIHINGVEGFVFHYGDKGKKLTVSGWCDNHWRWNDGDLVQLITKVTPDGAHGGTYRMDKVKHCGDPSDMYFVDVTFVGSKS